MPDDDLRFGDVNGGGGTGGGGILELMIRGFVGLIMLYVILRTVEILLNISIPFI
jgi:hypothetical protein